MKIIEGNIARKFNTFETVRIEISNGSIEKIRTYKQVDESLPVILPGFIDIHVHGGGKADTMDGTFEAYETIAATHAKHGTTSLLLTTLTDSIKNTHKVLGSVKEYMSGPQQGARVIGVHLEGPFIHPNKAGAHNNKYVLDPNLDIAKAWFETGVVKMITLAPERPQAGEIGGLARKLGIVASVGHTEAGKNNMIAAKNAGFSHVTHLCNAMKPFLHREVGPVGYVVEDSDFTGDLICDGVHLDSAMVKMLIRSIGPERLMLISDAMRAADAGDGCYDLGGLTVYVKDGVSRIAGGALGGSVLTMDHAVSMVQKMGGISLYEAQLMASTNSARKLGLLQKGRIEEGYDADLVSLDPSGNVRWTMVEGRVVYDAEI